MRFSLNHRVTGTAAAGLAVALAAMSACSPEGTPSSAPQQNALVATGAAAATPVVALASVYSKRNATDGATQISTRPLSGPRKLKGFTRPLNTSGVTPRSGLRAAYIQAVQSTANETYRPQQASASVARMDNVRHALHAELDASGPHITQTGTGTGTSDAGHSLAFSLVRYGCEGGAGAIQAARPTARGQRVTYARGDVTEWYQNGPMGVEQGFDLRSRPTCAASGGVELELNVQTDLQAALVGSSDSPSIELRDEQGKPLFHYTDLSAFDSDSKPVPARMSLSGHKIVLRMDDRGARYPLHVDPLIWAQIGAAHKAVDDTTATSVADDRVGTSIAVSGDTAVVGCPNCDDDGTDAGAAFIFTRTAPGTWAQQIELRAGGTAGAHSGQSVAITDIGGGTKRVIVGAPDDAGDGTATFWKGSAATWVPEITWGPYAFGNTKYGAAVAVSNDRILIGGPGYNTNDGLVSIVEPVGGTYTEVLPVIGATGKAEALGSSVAIDGTLAVAGAPHRKNLLITDAGGYDTFLRSGGTWALADTTMGSAPGQVFGTAMALSGTIALDAAPGDVANTGVVAADTLDATTGKYVSTQILLGNGLVPGDRFGSAVAIDGNVAVVGAPPQASSTGNAYVFRRNTTTGIWAPDPAGALTRTAGAATAGELFGTSVAVNSTATVPFILVGAPGNGTPANSGAFYEFIQLKQNGDACGAMGGDSECFSGFCVDGVCCNSACGRVAAGNDNVNDCQACAIAAGAVVNGTCGPARAAQVCNPKTANGCDLDAVCQLGSMVCPNKLLRSAGTVCRAAAGACDLAEVCDGISGACPATDSKLSAGTICRSAAGPCDLAETCDGTSVDCPATDAKQPNTFVCRTAAGLCDIAETCNGGNSCPADAISAAGTVCRTAQSECDTDELCDGATVGCPIDSNKVDGASCSAGSCQAGMCRVEAEVALSMTASPPHTTLQNPVTVTLTIQNNGPSPASQLQVQLTSEDGATLQGASGTGFTCQSGQGVITCTGTDLAAKSSVTLTVSAIPPYTKSNFSVSGLVTSTTYDPVTANNAASVVVINDNPQTPGLSGGGFGCSLTPGSRTPAASGLFTLALAALGLLIRRRRLV